MMEYSRALNEKEWSEHYNTGILENVLNAINTGEVSIWTKELERICEGNVLEIGCGSGTSSLWLSKKGLKVTALDFSKSSIELVGEAAKRLSLDINVVQADATKDLPFGDKQFDYIFQAGLLEHFETEKQIKLLANWKKYSKYMISLIPNASSIPYRIGKKIMEDMNTWEYGLEIPKHSLAEEFTRAGIAIEKEYSIGTKWAQSFLPQKHYVNKLFDRMEKDGYNLDEYMQGYLLVTIGKC